MKEKSGGKKQYAVSPCKIESIGGPSMSDTRACPQPRKDRHLRSRKSSESEFELFFSSNEDGNVSPNITLLTEFLRREGALTDGNKLCRVSGTYLTEKLIVAVIKLNRFSETEIYKWICACLSRRILSGKTFFDHIYKIVGKYDKAALASVVEKQKYLEKARSTLYVVPPHLEIEKPKYSNRKGLRNEDGHNSAISKVMKSEQVKSRVEGSQKSLACVRKTNVERKSNVENFPGPVIVRKMESEVSGVSCKTEDIRSRATPHAQSDKELGLTSVPITYSKPGPVLYAVGESSRHGNPSWVLDRNSKSLSSNLAAVPCGTNNHNLALGIPLASSSVEVSLKDSGVVCDGVIASVKAKDDPVLGDDPVKGFCVTSSTAVIGSTPDVLVTPKDKVNPDSGGNLGKGFHVIRSSPNVAVAPKVKGKHVSGGYPVKRFSVTSGSGVASGTPDVLDRLGKYGISVRLITEGSRNAICGVRSSSCVENDKVPVNQKGLLETETYAHAHENQSTQPDVINNLLRGTESQSTMFGSGKGTSALEFQGMLGGSRSEGDTSSVTVSRVKLKGEKRYSGVSHMGSECKLAGSQIVAETVTSSTVVQDRGDKGNKLPSMKSQMKGRTISITVCRKVVKHTLSSCQSDKGGLNEVAESVEKDPLIAGHEKFIGGLDDTYMITCVDKPQSLLQDSVSCTRSEIPVLDEGGSLVQAESEDRFHVGSSDTLDTSVGSKLPSSESSNCGPQNEAHFQNAGEATCTLQKKIIQDSKGNDYRLRNLVKLQDLEFESNGSDPYHLVYPKHSIFDGIGQETSDSMLGQLAEDGSKDYYAAVIAPLEEVEGNKFPTRSRVTPLSQSNDDKTHIENECEINDGISSVQDNIGSCGPYNEHPGVTGQNDVCKDPRFECKGLKSKVIDINTVDDTSEVTVRTNEKKNLQSEVSDLVPQCNVKYIPLLPDPVVGVKQASLSDSGISLNQSQSLEHSPTSACFGSNLGVSFQNSEEDVGMVTSFGSNLGVGFQNSEEDVGIVTSDSPSEDKLSLSDTKTMNPETDSQSIGESYKESQSAMTFNKIMKEEGLGKDTDDNIREAYVDENVVVYNPGVEKVLEGHGRMTEDEGPVKDTDIIVREAFIGQKMVADGHMAEKMPKELEVLPEDGGILKDTDSNSKKVHCSQKITADNVTAEEVWKRLKVVVHDKGTVKDTGSSNKKILEGQKLDRDGSRAEITPECHEELVGEGSLNDRDGRKVAKDQKTAGDGPRVDIALKAYEEVVGEGSLKDKDEREIPEDMTVKDASRSERASEEQEESLKDRHGKEVPKYWKTVGEGPKTEKAYEGNEEVVGVGSLKDIGGRQVAKDQKTVGDDQDGGLQKEIDGREIPKKYKTTGDSPLGEKIPKCNEMVIEGFLKDKDGKKVPKDLETVGDGPCIEKAQGGNGKVNDKGSGKDKDIGEISEAQKTVGDDRMAKVHEDNEKMVIEGSQRGVYGNGNEAFEDQKTVGNGMKAEVPEINQANPVPMKLSESQPGNLEALKVPQVLANTPAAVKETQEEMEAPRLEFVSHDILCSFEAGISEVPLGSRKELKTPETNVEGPGEVKSAKIPVECLKSMEVTKGQPSCETVKVSKVPLGSPKMEKTTEAHFGPHEASEIFKTHLIVSEEVEMPEVNSKDSQNLKLVKAIPGLSETVKTHEAQSLELLKIYDDDRNLEAAKTSEVPVYLGGEEPVKEWPGCLKSPKALDIPKFLRTVDMDPVDLEIINTPETSGSLVSLKTLGAHPSTSKEIIAGPSLVIFEEINVSAHPNSSEEVKANTHHNSLEEGNTNVYPEELEASIHSRSPDKMKACTHLGYPDEVRMNAQLGSLKVAKASALHGTSKELKTKAGAYSGSSEEIEGNVLSGSPKGMEVSARPGSLVEMKADSHPENSQEVKASVHPRSPGVETIPPPEEVKTNTHPGRPEEMKASGHSDITEETKVRFHSGISEEVKNNAYPSSPEQVKACARSSIPKEVKVTAHLEEIKYSAHPDSLDEVKASACSGSSEKIKGFQDYPPASSGSANMNEVHYSPLEAIEATDDLPYLAAPRAYISPPWVDKGSTDLPSLSAHTPHLLTSEAVEPPRDELLGIPKADQSTPETIEVPVNSLTLAPPKVHISPEAIKSLKDKPTLIGTRARTRIQEAVEVCNDLPPIAVLKTCSIAPKEIENPKELNFEEPKAPCTPKAVEGPHCSLSVEAPKTDIHAPGAVKSPKDRPTRRACKARHRVAEAKKLCNNLPTPAALKTDFLTQGAVKSPKGRPTRRARKAHLSIAGTVKVLSDLPTMSPSKSHHISTKLIKPPKNKISQKDLKAHPSTPEAVKVIDDLPAKAVPDSPLITPKVIKPPKDRPAMAAPRSSLSPPEGNETLNDSRILETPETHFITPEAVRPHKDSLAQVTSKAHQSPVELMEILDDSPTLAAPNAHHSTPETLKILKDEAALKVPKIHDNITEAFNPSKDEPVLVAPKAHFNTPEVVKILEDKISLQAPNFYLNMTEAEAPNDLTELAEANTRLSTTEMVKSLRDEPVLGAPDALLSTRKALEPSKDLKVEKMPRTYPSPPGVETGDCTTFIMHRVPFSTTQAIKQPKDLQTEAAPKTCHGHPEMMEMPSTSPPLDTSEASLNTPEVMEISGDPKVRCRTPDEREPSKSSSLLAAPKAHVSCDEVVKAPNDLQIQIAPKDHINTLNTIEVIQVTDNSPTLIAPKPDICTVEEVEMLINAGTMISSEAHVSTPEKMGVPDNSPTLLLSKAHPSTLEKVGVPCNLAVMVVPKVHLSTSGAVEAPGNSPDMVLLSTPERGKPNDNSPVVPLNPCNGNCDSSVTSQTGRNYYLAHNINPEEGDTCPEVSLVVNPEDTRARGSGKEFEDMLGKHHEIVHRNILGNGRNLSPPYQELVNCELSELSKDYNTSWVQIGQEFHGAGKDVNISGVEQDGESSGPSQDWESAQKKMDGECAGSGNRRESAGLIDGENSSSGNNGNPIQPSSNGKSAHKRIGREYDPVRNIDEYVQAKKGSKPPGSKSEGELQKPKKDCESQELKKDYKFQDLKEDRRSQKRKKDCEFQKLDKDCKSQELNKDCKSQELNKDCESPEPKDCDSSEPRKDYALQLKKSDSSSGPEKDGKMSPSKMECITSEPGNDPKSSGSRWDSKTCETKKYYEDSASQHDYNSSGVKKDKSSRPLRDRESPRPKDFNLSKPKKDSSAPGPVKECKSSVSKKDYGSSKSSKNYDSSGGKDGGVSRLRGESDFSKATKDYDYSQPSKDCEPLGPRKSSRSRKDSGSWRLKRDRKYYGKRKDCDFGKSRSDRDSSGPKKDYEHSGEDKGHHKDPCTSRGRSRYECVRHAKSCKERRERESCERSLKRSCQEDSQCRREGSSRPDHCDRSEFDQVSASTCQKGSAGDAQAYKMSLKSIEDGNGRAEKTSGIKRERSQGDREEVTSAHLEKPYEEIVKKLKRTENELQQWKVKCKEHSMSAEWKREIEELKLINKDLQKAKSLLSDKMSSMKERINVQKAQMQTLSKQLEGFVTSAGEKEVNIKEEKLPSPRSDYAEERWEPKSPDTTEAFHGWHEDQIKSNRAFVECTGFALKSAIASLQKRQKVSHDMDETMTGIGLDYKKDVLVHDTLGVFTHIDVDNGKDTDQKCKERHCEEIVSCSSSGVIEGKNFKGNGLGNSRDHDPLVVRQVQGKDSFLCRYPEMIENAHVTEGKPLWRDRLSEEVKDDGASCKAVKIEFEQEPKVYLDNWTEPEPIIYVDKWTQSGPLDERTYDQVKIKRLESKIKEVLSDNDKLVHKIKEHEEQLVEKEIEWLKILWDKEMQIKKVKNSKPENEDIKEKVGTEIIDNHECTAEAKFSGEIKYQDLRKLKERCKFSGEVHGTACEKLKTLFGKEEAQRKRKPGCSNHPSKNPQGKKTPKMSEAHVTAGTSSSGDGYRYSESGDDNCGWPRLCELTQPVHGTPEDESEGQNSKSSSNQGYNLPSDDVKEQTKELQELRAEVQRLKEQLESQKDEFETARKQIQVLEDQLELRSNDRNALKHCMKLKEQHTIKVLNRYEQSLKGKTNQIQVLQATINKMKEQLEAVTWMQKDFVAREKGFKDIQAQLKKKQKETNESLCKKQEQIALLQTQVACFRKQVEEQTKSLKEKVIQAEISDGLSKDLQKHMHSKNRSLSETVEKMETQLSKTREEMKDLSNKASKEEAEALYAKREQERLCKVVAAKEKELMELTKNKQQELETIAKKEEELRNCAVKEEELKNSLSSYEEMECELKDQLQGLNDELKKLIQEKNSVQEQLRGKEEELKTVVENSEKMKEELESSQRDCVSYQEEASNLKRKLEEQTQASDCTLSAEREKLCKLKEKHTVEMKTKKKLQNELYQWKMRKSSSMRDTKHLQGEVKHLNEVALHNQTCYEIEKERVAHLSELLAEETRKASQAKNQLISMNKVAEELRRLLKAEQDECIDQIEGQLEIFCATTDRYRYQKDRIERILNNPVLQVRISDFQEETS